MNNVEDKRNRLNLELRSLLSIIEMIDGLKGEYENYESGSLNEEEFLDEQIKLAVDARTRLRDVFEKK